MAENAILKENYNDDKVKSYAAGEMVEDTTSAPPPPPEVNQYLNTPDNEALDTALGPQSGIQAQGLQDLAVAGAAHADQSLDEYKANMYNPEWLANHNLGMAMGTLSTAAPAAQLAETQALAKNVGIKPNDAGIRAVQNANRAQAFMDTLKAQTIARKAAALRGYADGGEIPSEVNQYLGQDSAPQSSEPPAEVGQYLQDIPHLETPSEKYSAPREQIKAGLEGAARGLVGGALATGAERALGVNPEDIRGREEVNPGIAGTAEAGAFVGSMFTPMGQAAALSKAADAVVHTGVIANKIGQAALKGAVEVGLMDASDEVGKMLREDPEASAQSAIAGIGLNSVLGAGLGGATGAIGKLAKIAIESKGGQAAKQAAADFLGTVRQGVHTGDIHELIRDELEGAHHQAEYAKGVLYGGEDLKGQAIKNLVPEQITEDIHNQVNNLIEKVEDHIEQAQARPDIYPPHLANSLEKQLDRFKGQLSDAGDAPAGIFDAMQDFKNNMYEAGNPRMPVPGHDPAHAYVSFAKGLSKDLRAGLENQEVWGKAGKLQQDINAAVAPSIDAHKNFKGAFMSKLPDGSHVIDEGKVASFVNNIEKPGQAKKIAALKSFLETNQGVQEQINKAYKAAGIDAPTSIIPTSNAALNYLIKEKTPGMKLGEAFLSATESKHLGSASGAGVGGVLGHGVGGIPGAVLGAKVGEKLLAPMFERAFKAVGSHEAVKSALQMVMNKMGTHATNAADMAEALDHVDAIYKGQSAMEKGVKALFKKGAKDLMDHFTPSNSDLKQLKQKLAYDQADPNVHPIQSTLASDNALTKLTTGQGEAKAATTYAAKQALINSRPSSDPKTPLDQRMPISKQDQAVYNNRLMLIQQPNMIIAKLQRGNLTPNDIATIKSVYPGYYNQLVKKITAEVINAKHKDVTIPYQMKQNLTLLLGQPMESTLTQPSIAAAQMTHQMHVNRPQQSGQLSATKKQTHAVDKLVAQYQTPEQSRMARQNKK